MWSILRQMSGKAQSVTTSTRILAFVALTTVWAGGSVAPGPTAAQTPPQPPPPSRPQGSTFTVFVKGTPIGAEQVNVTGGSEGWTITGSARLGPPLDLTVRRLELRYDPAWRPRELTVDAIARGEPLKLHTTFRDGSAVSEITRGVQTSTKTDAVAADTIVLPNLLFGTYEALAARLAGAAPGAEFKAYVAPQAEIPARLTSVTDERIQTAARSIAARRYRLTFTNPGGPLELDIWVENGRFLRLDVPQQSVSVVREDVASVAARRETVSRPGDEPVTIPANGFSLAGTISKPSNAQGRPLPAIVLVAGSGATDRDETVAGIPIFGQLAGALADAGFVVVRYDKRGVGQSGGRWEAATLADYAEDVRAAVKFLASRKDVDRKRITVAGHSEGGWVSLLAAAREGRIRSLVLIATPSTSGADLVLAQQQYLLDRSAMSAGEKQRAIETQKKILKAVASGAGWDEIPADVRRRVETPWYQSLTAFDPARILPKVRQPILIVQGELDRQVFPSHADRLAELARSRKKSADVRVAHIAGVNHLLVPASTGEVDEYGQLGGREVSKEVVSAIVAWLTQSAAIVTSIESAVARKPDKPDLKVRPTRVRARVVFVHV